MLSSCRGSPLVEPLFEAFCKNLSSWLGTNLLNFLVIIANSSSSSLSSSSSSLSSFVEALRAPVLLVSSSSSPFFMVSSWVIREPKSSSRGSLVRSLASWMAVTLASPDLGRDLRIFLTSSLLESDLPRDFKALMISVKRVNICVIDSSPLRLSLNLLCLCRLAEQQHNKKV